MKDPIAWLTAGLLAVTFAYMVLTWRSTGLMKASVSYQAAADRLAVLPLIGIEIELVEEELFDVLHNREALCTIRLVSLRDIAPVNIFASVQLRIGGQVRGIRWRSRPIFPFIRSGGEVVFQRYLGVPFAELVDVSQPWATATGVAVSHPRLEVEIIYRNHWKRRYRSV